MAENTQLAAFLEDGRPPQAEPQTPAPEPQPATATPEPKPESKPEADDDTDGLPPKPLEGEDVVAFRAFQDERKKRQDWKERAVRNEERAAANEARAALLERQLEEAKRAAAQPPPQQQHYQPPPEIPNPAHDPQGYHNYMQQQQHEAEMHRYLNFSEMLAVEKHGEEAVEAMKREFLAAKDRDPTLGQRLLQQKDPYGWAMKEMDKQRRMAEIGDDPAAWRARIEAEARAKWEAETQQRGPGVPNMQPSLATARSVAGRSQPAWTGEPSLEDLVSSIQNRKKQRV